MQQLDSNYETAVKRGYTLVGKPLVVAEWNFNKLINTTVTTTPDDQNWILGNQFFSPASVAANGIKPNSGIFYGFTDMAYTASEATLGISSARYYVHGDGLLYNYWICPTFSHEEKVNSEGAETDSSLPEEYAVDRGELKVEYDLSVNTNKIRVVFNLGPIPVSWKILVHLSDASTQEIDNATINEITGECELWWNGSAWTTTQQLSSNVYLSVKSIEIVVNSVNRPSDQLQIIEVSARREIDISSRIQDYSINLTMDQTDFIHPVGSITASDGHITIDNRDLGIANDDDASDFRGLLEGWCQYRTYVTLDLSKYGGSNALQVRTGSMFASGWQQSNEYEYTVDLFDIIKLLQLNRCPALLFENESLARILSRLLDNCGIDSYNLDPTDFDATGLVKYFWTDGTETFYDAISRLCKSYQAAIFADEFGVIQLLVRSQISNPDDTTTVWTFKGQKQGLDLPDIKSLSKKYDLQANDITIKYKQMEAKVDAQDLSQQPLTTVVWDSQDSIVLRAAPLTRVLEDVDPGTNHDIWIDSTLAATWPYSGHVNIDGETIEYKSKGYIVWDYSTTPPTWIEKEVKSDEDKRKFDLETWQSFEPNQYITGGVSTDPTKQNKFSGRLFVLTRASDGANNRTAHGITQKYGWMGLKGWVATPGNPKWPTKYYEPGNTTSYTLNNLKDWVGKPGWTTTQSRWTVANSIMTCDNNSDGNSSPNICVTDTGDTEFRELGARIRFKTDGVAGLIFYMSDRDGYDVTGTPTLDPTACDRAYLFQMATTAWVDKNSRAAGYDEIGMQAKNGNKTTDCLNHTQLSGYKGTKKLQTPWTITKGKWYDVTVVVRDSLAYPNETHSATTWFEVFIDGQFVDTFYTGDAIRPTSLMGFFAKYKCTVDFEYLYATTTTLSARPKYNDDLFSGQSLIFAPGTNKTASILLPALTVDDVITITTVGSNATLSNAKFVNYAGAILSNIGNITLKPDRQLTYDLKDISGTPTQFNFTYTSSNYLSVCIDSTYVHNYPYDQSELTLTPSTSFYDYVQGGYSSAILNNILYTGPQFNSAYLSRPEYVRDPVNRTYYDDFGSIVHEIRDFNVDLDTIPAKGIRCYFDNESVVLIDEKYNPAKGIFTLANASHRDEIVAGSEQIDSSNSIDHTLILYGYVLEDKGDKTKQIKNDDSIRKYGSIATDFDADWIFNEDDATELGNWITENWGEPMDTIELNVYGNLFTQIGDKVHILYDNANIDSTWKYIVTNVSRTFTNTGLEASVTLRRVR